MEIKCYTFNYLSYSRCKQCNSFTVYLPLYLNKTKRKYTLIETGDIIYILLYSVA